jgi:tetratricopeptide (TPR) repeat protein
MRYIKFWVIVCSLIFSSYCLMAQSPDSTKIKADKFFNEEKYREAIKEYEKLPVSAETQKNIGIAHMKLWNMSAALRSLRQAEKYSKNDLSVKAYIAEVMSWNKEFDDAIELYRDIFSKGYNRTEARLAYARTLAWSKEYDNAISEYQLILKNDPLSFEALSGLAQTLSWQKKFNPAIEAYKKAIEVTDNSKEKSIATMHIAQIQSWQGLFESSIKTYEESYRLNKNNVDALFGLGEVHEWMSKYAAAKKYYEQILQIQPDHKQAKAKLLQLMWVK